MAPARSASRKAPLAPLHHGFPRVGWQYAWPSSRLTNCLTFAAMCQADKRHLITQLRACSRCSSRIHEAGQCPLCTRSCTAMEGGRQCRGNHLHELHDGPRLLTAPGAPKGGPVRYLPSPPPGPPTGRREPQAALPRPEGGLPTHLQPEARTAAAARPSPDHHPRSGATCCPKDTEVTAQPGQAPHDTPLAPRVPNQLSRSLRRPAGPPTAWGPRSNSSTAWPGLPSCRASWGGATGGEGLGCPPCQARLLLRGQPVEHGAYGPDEGCPARHLPCRPPRSIPGRGGPPRPLGPVPPAGPSAQEH